MPGSIRPGHITRKRRSPPTSDRGRFGRVEARPVKALAWRRSVAPERKSPAQFRTRFCTSPGRRRRAGARCPETDLPAGYLGLRELRRRRHSEILLRLVGVRYLRCVVVVLRVAGSTGTRGSCLPCGAGVRADPVSVLFRGRIVEAVARDGLWRGERWLGCGGFGYAASATTGVQISAGQPLMQRGRRGDGGWLEGRRARRRALV